MDATGASINRAERVEEAFAVLSKVAAELPPDLPRFLADIWQPDEVVQAVMRAGVDLFDGSLPYRLSRAGIAWVYSEESASDEKPHYYVFPLAKEELMKNGAGDCTVYETPLQKNCSCFACQRHSLGYVSHLHSVNEMLAQILLMM